MRPCIFCKILENRAPASRVDEDERFVAFLDIYPMRPGHTLIIPRRHVVRVAELGDDAAALFAFGVRIAAAARAGLACDDVNFALNDGPAANQSVPHVHLHVIPRRSGDTGRLIARLLVRPWQPALGGPARDELDAVAEKLRAGQRAAAAAAAFS